MLNMKFMLKEYAKIQSIFVLLFDIKKFSTKIDWYYDIADNNITLFELIK